MIWYLRLTFQVQILDNVACKASKLTFVARCQVLIDCKLQLACSIWDILDTVCGTNDLSRVVLEVEARVSVRQFLL